jgi:hypothetical protein
MVAPSVGGIQDQIADERDGLPVDDPADLDAFVGALAGWSPTGKWHIGWAAPPGDGWLFTAVRCCGILSDHPS